MKITRERLKQIIKEELKRLSEAVPSIKTLDDLRRELLKKDVIENGKGVLVSDYDNTVEIRTKIQSESGDRKQIYNKLKKFIPKEIFGSLLINKEFLTTDMDGNIIIPTHITVDEYDRLQY